MKTLKDFKTRVGSALVRTVETDEGKKIEYLELPFKESGGTEIHVGTVVNVRGKPMKFVGLDPKNQNPVFIQIQD